jgi:hypothetical protein
MAAAVQADNPRWPLKAHNIKQIRPFSRR